MFYILRTYYTKCSSKSDKIDFGIVNISFQLKNILLFCFLFIFYVHLLFSSFYSTYIYYNYMNMFKFKLKKGDYAVNPVCHLNNYIIIIISNVVNLICMAVAGVLAAMSGMLPYTYAYRMTAEGRDYGGSRWVALNLNGLHTLRGTINP